MSKASESLPVIIIQGFGAPRFTNLAIKTRLLKDNFRAYDVDLPGFNTQDIEISSLSTSEKVKQVLELVGSEKVNLIGISMGGLIGLHYLRKNGGNAFVEKFITLGCPFYGTPGASLIKKIMPNLRAAEQMEPNSDFLNELHTDDANDCQIYSILDKGDVNVSEASANLKGAQLIKLNSGIWPFGHYTPLIFSEGYNTIKQMLLKNKSR